MVTATEPAVIPADALRLSWDDVLEQSVQLAKMIETHCQKTGEQFDLLLVVPRGSYYPANIISRILGFGSTDILHACIKSYELNVGESTRSDFTLGQMPDPKQVKGKQILIIEEVNDTGHTMKFLVEWLQAAGATLVRAGALHYKPKRNEAGFVPDWYVGETDQWIVYPWEIYEEQGKTSRVRRGK